MLVSVLAALALVAFFIGLVRYVHAAGDAKGHAEGRERIIWSLIALFILFSIWGILNILSITFFGSADLSQGGVYPYPATPTFNGVGNTAAPY